MNIMNTLSLTAPDWVWIILMSFMGLTLGSFFGVLADRLSVGDTPTGRSKCDHCRKQLHPRDMIPVLSYVLARGRSRCCGKALSRWYPGVEIMTGLAYAGLTWYALVLMPGYTLTHIVALFVIVSAGCVIIMADFKYHIIPDMMSALLALVGLALALMDGQAVYHLTAGIVLLSILYAVYASTRGKGMGFGDVKFAGVMGLVLGLKDGMLALYLAFLLGGLFGIGLLLGRRAGLKSSMAFGPFLVAGMLVMLLCGREVWAVVGKLF